MAIRSLEMQHFLGKTVTHQFRQRNKIVGANGVGKSSIKEALCFVFTGRDSFGNRNPQHLISVGEDSTRVVVTTDKAEISRTLTRGANGTLKVNRGQGWVVYTQAQFEAVMGSTDLILSTFIPGYFLSMKAAEQHAVLSQVLPKVDKDILLKDITGITLTAEEILRWGVKMKKADIVANSVAVERRAAEKQINQYEGNIDELRSIKALPKPEESGIAAELLDLESTMSLWSAYRTQKVAYDKDQAQAKWHESQNQQNQIMREELLSQMDKIQFKEMPEVDGTLPSTDELIRKLKLLPPAPAVMSVIDADNCPTCGQTVGVRHRDKVKADNERIVAEHSALCEKIKAENAIIEAEIVRIKQITEARQKTISEIKTFNTQAEKKLNELKLQYAGIVDTTFQATLKEPAAPEKVVDAERLHVLKEAHKKYLRELGAWEENERQRASAQEKIDKLLADIATLKQVVERLRAIEQGLAQVPQEEMRRQLETLKMPTVSITVNDSIVVTRNGIHYNHLSTGQRMSADIEICRKLNELRPLGMVFLDNADLVDQFDWGDYQMFAAFVDATKTEVTIEENT